MSVELIYDSGCPNVGATRSALIKAFARTGVSARWREWERSAPDCPDYARAFGSPTLLVDGNDVAGGAVQDAASCRVYLDKSGQIARTPPFDSICSALMRGARAGAGRSRRPLLAASVPAIGTALLPKLVCPLCFPAYTALLGALGLGFVDYTPYLLPLTAAFLTLALGALLIHAYRRGRWLPLSIGLFAAGVIVFGKFYAEIDWVSFVGVALLVAAVIMTMRRKASRAVSCPACAPVEARLQQDAR